MSESEKTELLEELDKKEMQKNSLYGILGGLFVFLIVIMHSIEFKEFIGIFF